MKETGKQEKPSSQLQKIEAKRHHASQNAKFAASASSSRTRKCSTERAIIGTCVYFSRSSTTWAVERELLPFLRGVIVPLVVPRANCRTRGQIPREKLSNDEFLREGGRARSTGKKSSTLQARPSQLRRGVTQSRQALRRDDSACTLQGRFATAPEIHRTHGSPATHISLSRSLPPSHTGRSQK